MIDIEKIINVWEDCNHGVDANDIKKIWNLAIEHAVSLVESKYDEQGPLLEPGDMEGLYITENDLME